MVVELLCNPANIFFVKNMKRSCVSVIRSVFADLFIHAAKQTLKYSCWLNYPGLGCKSVAARTLRHYLDCFLDEFH